MKTLIVLSNQHVSSVSKNMLDEFIRGQKDAGATQIDTLNLYAEKIEFLNFEELHKMEEKEDNIALYYAKQISRYDKVVFVYPFWNFNFPAIIKAYIDYICYAGITFKYTEHGPEGLLKNTKFTSLVASGGDYGQVPSYRHDVGYLSHIATFLGATYVEGIRCEGTNIPDRSDDIINEAVHEAYEFGKTF